MRVRILGLLDERTASPNQVAGELGLSLGVVAYHVRTLAELGFLELVDRRQRRGAVEHYYRAASRPRVASAVWETIPTVVKQAMVASALGHISDLVNAAAAAGGFERAQAHLSRTPLDLDEEGLSEVAAELDALVARLLQIGKRAARRASAQRTPLIRAPVVLMLFEQAPS